MRTAAELTLATQQRLPQQIVPDPSSKEPGKMRHGGILSAARLLLWPAICGTCRAEPCGRPGVVWSGSKQMSQASMLREARWLNNQERCWVACAKAGWTAGTRSLGFVAKDQKDTVRAGCFSCNLRPCCIGPRWLQQCMHIGRTQGATAAYCQQRSPIAFPRSTRAGAVQATPSIQRPCLGGPMLGRCAGHVQLSTAAEKTAALAAKHPGGGHWP